MQFVFYKTLVHEALKHAKAGVIACGIALFYKQQKPNKTLAHAQGIAAASFFCDQDFRFKN